MQRVTKRGKVRTERAGKKRGQAVVEFALLGIFLATLLAGTVDFGRAWYTAIIVTNMAGEGAAYAALFPDQDVDPNNSASDSCSAVRPVPIEKSIQERARRVAKDQGMVVSSTDQNSATISVTTEGYGSSCEVRCTGRTVTVKVTYTLNDLFLPGMLGFHDIPITRSASQTIQRDVQVNGSCSGSGAHREGVNGS